MQNVSAQSTLLSPEKYFSPLFSVASDLLLRSWGGFAPGFLLSCQLVGNFANHRVVQRLSPASSIGDSALNSNASGLFVCPKKVFTIGLSSQ